MTGVDSQMAEAFLEEQLERIKRLTEQMKQVSSQSAELSDTLAHHRETTHHTPLDDVRDYRTYPKSMDTRSPSSIRESTGRGSSRRRRR